MKEKDNQNIYPHITTWDVVKEYWKSARFHWLLGVSVLVGVTVSNLAQNIIAPLYYKEFFDTLANGDPSITLTSTLLITILFSILGLNLISWIGYRMAGFCQNFFFFRVGQRLIEHAFGGLVDHSHSFFSNNFSGSLVQKVNRYNRSFGRLFDRLSGDIVPLFIKVTAASIVLYYLKPVIAGVVLIWIAVFVMLSYSLAKVKLKYDILTAKADSRLTGTIADSISNHNSIQPFTGNAEEMRLLNISNTYFYRTALKRWNIGSIIDSVQALLALAIEFFIFYFGIKYWQAGALSLGTFVLIQAYVISIGGSLWNFSRVVRDLYEATADAKEMVEILKLPHEIQDVPNAPELKVPEGKVEFKNVSFTFGKNEQNKPVFTNLSISIKAGEKVALIGSSGAGKSTFVKLLLRLHDLKGGEILIDGQNISQVTQESLRENISLVPQDPALFHRTLMENIRYGRRDASDEEVIEASRLAHCDIFIKDFPQKYETFVGERGIKLSGGERQRVAIARALLKNAPILVLDEATSSLDSHSESLIQDALHTLMRGKTTLVIAHRLSTIRKMDRIIVLGKDGVLEEGSHEELIRAHGIYARLWNLQAGGFADKSIEDMLEGE